MKENSAVLYKKFIDFVRWLYELFARSAITAIIFCALFCTLAVKLFHSIRSGLLTEYLGWIITDVAVLLTVEVALVAVCFKWQKRWLLRICTFLTALICAWSVMNAAWIIRTGTQLLPATLLPLVRDPLNAFIIVGINLAKMPVAAVALLGPSAIALIFFFIFLTKLPRQTWTSKTISTRAVIAAAIITLSFLIQIIFPQWHSRQIISAGLRYNSQLKAVVCLFRSISSQKPYAVYAEQVLRKIPSYDQAEAQLAFDGNGKNYNLVLIVLEGIQYQCTSFADKEKNLTPYLSELAAQGVVFQNAHSTLTHTTKALFSILTGRYPCVSQDIAETVPVEKPYASIATILKQQMDFRTAFFQSAKGNFEARPALVHNLGFNKFWAREDLNDSNAFLGYLACDEFRMLKPITEWIQSDDKPFFLTIMCSVTHDPYEVPQWFAEPANDIFEKYQQTIRYTDKFISALNSELAELQIADRTIFCVVGDHGEAFGEHGLMGHERIAFEEALHVPLIIRADGLVEPGTCIENTVSSIDVTPTLLALMKFNLSGAKFDGCDVLGDISDDRKVYFSSWAEQSPIGFLQQERKYIYYPENEIVSVYDLKSDPLEKIRIESLEKIKQEIADEVTSWRKSTIFELEQQLTGKITIFDNWLCRWHNRICWAKYSNSKESD